MPYAIVMTKTILLDLDGPLLDGKMRHYQCYSDILITHGYKPMPLDTYWGMKQLRRTRKEQLAVSGAEAIYDEFFDAWLSNIEKPEYLSLDKVQDGALEQLQAWISKGIQVVLVTMRSNRNALMQQLQATGLLPFLASVIVCRHANGGEGKVLELLREIPDIEFSTSLWVGDTEADLAAARYVGCSVCLLTCGLRTKKYLISLKPDCLRESLDKVNLEEMINYGT